MPGIYEQYAKYRTDELTEMEKFTIDRTQGFSLREAHGLIIVAKDRAQKQLAPWVDTGFLYPDSPDIMERFPGIDPKGNACEVDMEFAGRLARLKAVVSSRPLAAQSYVGQQLKNLEDSHSVIHGYWKRMKWDCMQILISERAAKLALTKESSEWLMDQAKGSARETDAIQHIDLYLNVLEYAAGLTDREPTPDERRFMRQLKAPLDDGVERRRHDSLMQPLKVEVEFANFDHKVQQKFFSSPLAWGKGPEDMPEDVRDEKRLEDPLDRYAPATADRVMGPLFERVEKTSGGIISRGDLITVDGKTMREIMVERFREVKDGGSFEQWYGNNVRQMTNDIVSAGLMAGKRVEAFVPDKTGRIPAEPAQVVKTGYEPSPLKKVTLNAWERHFAKRGFYKEKAAKAVEYGNVLAARERVKLKNVESQLDMDNLSNKSVKDMFFGEWQKETGEALPTKVPGGYSVERSALCTFAICGLAAKGYSMAQIMNPDLLKEEKAAMGREVMEHLTMEGSESEIQERKKWEAEILYNGRKSLNAQLDETCEHFDLTDAKKLFSEEARPLFALHGVLFDLSQEEDRVDRQMYEALAQADAPDKNPKETVQGLFDHTDSFCTYLNCARRALEGSCVISGADFKSAVGMDGALSEMGRFEYARRLYAEEKAKNPGVQPYLRVPSADFHLVHGDLSMNDGFNATVRSIATDPALGASVRRAAANGELFSRMSMSYDSGHEISFRVEGPSKEEAKKGERNRSLEEALRKNQEKKQEKAEKKQEKAKMEQEKAEMEQGKAEKKQEAGGRSR
ncbi:MAG: hypothetical protein K2O06_11595 [Acetatifactor sp.]|nr:hypothetical protein [Acetatifactor sp.]